MSSYRKFIGLWLTLALFAISLVVFFLLSRWLDSLFDFRPFLPDQYNVFFAALSIIAGIFWVFWAYSYIHFVGKGSPIEIFGAAWYPTRNLITTGPYYYTRNPMLLGQLFLLLAIAFYLSSISGLILIPILALAAILYIKLFEEPELMRRFGKEYAAYRKSVPALIPFPRR